jgi:hypothetical protein
MMEALLPMIIVILLWVANILLNHLVMMVTLVLLIPDALKLELATTLLLIVMIILNALLILANGIQDALLPLLTVMITMNVQKIVVMSILVVYIPTSATLVRLITNVKTITVILILAVLLFLWSVMRILAQEAHAIPKMAALQLPFAATIPTPVLMILATMKLVVPTV